MHTNMHAYIRDSNKLYIYWLFFLQKTSTYASSTSTYQSTTPHNPVKWHVPLVILGVYLMLVHSFKVPTSKLGEYDRGKTNMKWPHIPKQKPHYTYICFSLEQGFHDRLMKVVACMVKGSHPTIALFFYVCVW
jgi:hypothetical protein